MPERGVDEVADFGEVDDFVKLALDNVASHTVQTANDQDVVAHSEVVLESPRDVDQRCNAAAERNPTLIGNERAGYQPQQCALALSVCANDTNRLTLANLERHIAQRPELTARLAALLTKQVAEPAVAYPVAPKSDTKAVSFDCEGGI